jgi:hypothetical protein
MVGSLSLLREILAFRGVHVWANYFGNVKAVMQPNQPQTGTETGTFCANELVEPELDELSWNCSRGGIRNSEQHNSLKLVHQIPDAKKKNE